MKYILIMIAYTWGGANNVTRVPQGWSYIKTFENKDNYIETGKELVSQDMLMSFRCVEERK